MTRGEFLALVQEGRSSIQRLRTVAAEAPLLLPLDPETGCEVPVQPIPAQGLDAAERLLEGLGTWASSSRDDARVLRGRVADELRRCTCSRSARPEVLPHHAVKE